MGVHIDLDQASASAYELAHLLMDAAGATFQDDTTGFGGAAAKSAKTVKAAGLAQHFFAFLTQDISTPFPARLSGLTVQVRHIVGRMEQAQRMAIRAETADAVKLLAEAHRDQYGTPYQLKDKLDRVKRKTTERVDDQVKREFEMAALKKAIDPKQMIAAATIHAQAIEAQAAAGLSGAGMSATLLKKHKI